MYITSVKNYILCVKLISTTFSHEIGLVKRKGAIQSCINTRLPIWRWRRDEI